jgi:hypothetical protein
VVRRVEEVAAGVTPALGCFQELGALVAEHRSNRCQFIVAQRRVDKAGGQAADNPHAMHLGPAKERDDQTRTVPGTDLHAAGMKRHHRRQRRRVECGHGGGVADMVAPFIVSARNGNTRIIEIVIRQRGFDQAHDRGPEVAGEQRRDLPAQRQCLQRGTVVA